MNKNIVLTGFMGVGKTTTGKILARKLNMEFIDTDAELEERFGMSIREIFEKYGEDKFRESEAQLARELGNKSGYVIATGGGMVKSAENISNLKQNSIIINIYCSVDKILKNIKDTSSRPLIHGKTREDVAKLIESRTKYYRNADIRIATENLTANEAALEIIRLIKEGNRL